VTELLKTVQANQDAFVLVGIVIVVGIIAIGYWTREIVRVFRQDTLSWDVVFLLE
jgi:hypothetical protein